MADLPCRLECDLILSLQRSASRGGEWGWGGIGRGGSKSGILKGVGLGTPADSVWLFSRTLKLYIIIPPNTVSRLNYRLPPGGASKVAAQVFLTALGTWLSLCLEVRKLIFTTVLSRGKQGGLTHRDHGRKDYLLPSLEVAMVICPPPPRKKTEGGRLT